MKSSMRKDASVQIGIDEELLEADSTNESKVREWRFEEQDVFSDLQLVVNDRKFYCHKIMLSNCSPVFKAMLCGNFVEKSADKIEIKNIDPEAMEVALQAIYTPAYKCTSEKDALLMVPVIDQYQISHIQKEIDDKLYENVTLSNYKCLEFLRLARNFNLPRVKTVCLDIISRSSNKNYLQELKMSEDLREFELDLLRSRVATLETQLKNVDMCFSNPCVRIEKREVRVPINTCETHQMPLQTNENGEYCKDCVNKLKAHVKNVCNVDRIKTIVTYSNTSSTPTAQPTTNSAGSTDAMTTPLNQTTTTPTSHSNISTTSTSSINQ